MFGNKILALTVPQCRQIYKYNAVSTRYYIFFVLKSKQTTMR